MSCPFAQMYLSGRDMFKRSSFLYSCSSGTFTASTVNAVGGSQEGLFYLGCSHVQ